ncbi:hypothetical protein GJ744_004528 [Endocarpon pusillum]|uniref:Uncharacterized protein n=1 Tax=Endocarpon pusillum TaxID=364733 RepID=A0A8H7AS51_9EURO|nr:hypothetical protein GJ744_004528 [Endocarpon pusillum]
MKTSLLSFFLLSLISGSLASVGDTCGWDEKKGTCQDVKDCDGGFTFNDACPNDGANIKCCVEKECVKVQQAPLESLGGRCYDKRYNNCAGGHYERNLCPGDNNVQCCIKGLCFSFILVLNLDRKNNSFCSSCAHQARLSMKILANHPPDPSGTSQDQPPKETSVTIPICEDINVALQEVGARGRRRDLGLGRSGLRPSIFIPAICI